ncbi:hypothetical protein OF820_02075 [Oceanotoga sp. DSM 15011]|uniref:hypothetical protein n=1 Tax=Oceanotoga sp. DSM 15011 TaxID=2984951 RepID=UPI0021F40859|nr:hypothetical protein [Oceanotoga sp. DSM 15011]UYP00479.1 hypothetical protein OF820_02075 [Oceanotoga sp. DSM 15011]
MPTYRHYLKLRYREIMSITGKVITYLSFLILGVGSTSFIYGDIRTFFSFFIHFY